MTDLEKFSHTLKARADLQSIAQSAEGQNLMRKLDDGAVEAAVKNGDTAALKQLLGQVLATPEGKALAEKLQKAVKGK